MNRNMLGSNQFCTLHKYHFWASVWFIAFITTFNILIIEKTRTEPLSPCSEGGCISKVQATEPKKMTTDEMVDFYANKYGKYSREKLTIKVKLHYLLFRESAYGNSKNCGDGGDACGPMQFHEATYQGFRKIMMAKNLVNYIGSRLNLENAIETTAWAISDGRQNNWGPLARKEINL